jgi:hypothetical protein
MNGESWDATGLPDVYQITADRMEKLKGASVTKVATCKVAALLALQLLYIY